MNTNDTKSNFGKWGWSMILYCALSYYLAAALSTDTLNFFPSIFTELRGWDASAVDTMNTMAGVGGWFGVIAAFAFSILAAKMGSRVISVIGNILAGIICILFATTQNFTFFLILIVLMVFVSGSVQLSVVPNNLMNIWFPKKKGLALLMEHSTKGAEKRDGKGIKGTDKEDGTADVEKKAWKFDQKSLEAVCVFRLDVEKLSCKEHL